MIDWAPTATELFSATVFPQICRANRWRKSFASDEPVREGALFGVFSGHVENVTDGRYVYMRAAQPGVA